MPHIRFRRSFAPTSFFVFVESSSAAAKKSVGIFIDSFCKGSPLRPLDFANSEICLRGKQRQMNGKKPTLKDGI
jgi:hypothetical protein